LNVTLEWFPIMLSHPTQKPRVFLSHSKKDVEFIRRLEADLRACQCDPWIDEVELRHGQPWLEQIFSSGIPSCDVVLCYITENSIESEMVRQEIDARLVERLRSSRVTLLLYVAKTELRQRLRLDLQRLQVPELNADNYAKVFPRVVAEIWRSFSDSVAASAVQSERVRRLEAELRVKELESSAAATVFSKSEDAEFANVWSRIDREIRLDARLTSIKSSKPAEDQPDTATDSGEQLESTQDGVFWLKLSSLFRASIAEQKFQLSSYDVRQKINDDIRFLLKPTSSNYQVAIDMPVDVETEMLRYGFVERQPTPSPRERSAIAFFHEPFRLVFTPKFDRFGFWLEYTHGPWEPLSLVVRIHE
jgi:TIR domain